MVTFIFLPEGRWEGGHTPCHSLLWKWLSVVKVSRGVWSWSPSYFFQREGGKVAIHHAILLFGSG